MPDGLEFVQHDLHRRLLRQEMSDALSRGARGLPLYWPESRLFVARQIQGVMAERHGETLAGAEQQVRRAAVHLYAWFEGKILHDPGGHLPTLRRATALLAAYRTPAAERWALQHWLESAPIKLKGSSGDLRAAFLVQTPLWKLAEGLCAVNNRPAQRPDVGTPARSASSAPGLAGAVAAERTHARTPTLARAVGSLSNSQRSAHPLLNPLDENTALRCASSQGVCHLLRPATKGAT